VVLQFIIVPGFRVRKDIMHGLSIIIPTRNEADNIDLLLQRIFAVDYLQSVDHEVVFVDDSSTDATRDIIKKWFDRRPVRLVERDEDQGLAGAVIAASREAIFDTSLVIDADLSHPPENIPDLVSPVVEGEYDVMIGSRYVDGGATPEWPLSRKIASKLATLPARLFTDVNDPLAGFFAVSTRRLRELRSDVPGFKIGLEVLAMGGDQLRVGEVPIVFHDRFEGFSKMSLQIVFDYLRQVTQILGIQTGLFTPAAILSFIGSGSILTTLIFWAVQRYGLGPLEAHLVGSAAAGFFIFSIMTLLPPKARRGQLGFFRLVRQFLGFLLILIYATSIQGAFYHIGEHIFGLHPLAALALGAGAGATCVTFLSIIYLFSGISSLSPKIQFKAVAVGSVAALILLKLLYLGLPELMEQEAYYWNYAMHPSLSYLDHPPFAALLIWLGTALFGVTEFGVRIGAYLCWFVSAFFVYRLSSDLINRTAAWGSVLLLAILPLYFGSGFVLTPDSPLHAAWAGFIFFLYRALIKSSPVAWLGVGICLGVGLLSKYTIVLTGPGIFLFMLLDKRARSWFLRPQPYGAVLLALLLFAPVLIWNYQNDWVSFLFQGEQRVSGRMFFTADRLLAYITMLLTPAGMLGLCYFFTRGNRFFITIGGRGDAAQSKGLDRRYLFLLLLTVSPLAVFAVFSLTREVKLNWTSPLWLAVLPYLGCTIAPFYKNLRSWFHRLIYHLWKWFSVVLVGGYCLFLHYATLGLPGLPFNADIFLLGWQDLAEKVEAVVDEVEEYSGERPVVVGMDPYQISSGLAFYRAKLNRDDTKAQQLSIEETLGWHLFGWDGLMYEFWAEPDEYVGRDVVAVATSAIRVEFPYFQNRFDVMNNIHPIDVYKNDTFVSRYYFRVVHNYRLTRN